MFKPIPLDEPESLAVYEQSSILTNDESAAPPTTIIKRKPKSSQSDYLERSLGSSASRRETLENSKWIRDAKDIIEARRGTTIWPKKEGEVVAEVKKSASKPLLIPDNIARIVTAVYIEQSKKLSDIQETDKLGYTTFRKFMIELKKKTKKNPVLLTKLELTKVLH